MKTVLRYFMVWILTILLTSGLSFAQVETGQPAPDFSLPDSNGKTQTLSEYKGKFVVLEWLNPDCPFVKKHYDSGNMQQLQKDFTAQGVVWLTIDSSAPGKEGYYPPQGLSQFVQRTSASPTAVLMDPEGKVGRLFAAQTTPHMFVISPEGVVIYQGAIDSVPSADPADIAQAKNYVKAALEEAMAGSPVTIPATKAYGCSVKY